MKNKNMETFFTAYKFLRCDIKTQQNVKKCDVDNLSQEEEEEDEDR